MSLSLGRSSGRIASTMVPRFPTSLSSSSLRWSRVRGRVAQAAMESPSRVTERAWALSLRPWHFGQSFPISSYAERKTRPKPKHWGHCPKGEL